MPISELFSKRQKKLKGEYPDVFQYENIDQKFRVQVVHIIQDTIGTDEKRYETLMDKAYEYIHKTLCKEYGVFGLGKSRELYSSAIFNYFLEEKNHERCLDIIELSFYVIDTYVRQNWFHFESEGATQKPDDAIEELNARFKESGIGYQFEAGKLARIDSQFIHSEAVKPVLHLLGKDEKYAGANNEFLSAHEHCRHKRYKECLNDCLKSFESLMKAIHEKHSWSYDPKDTAQKLIDSCLKNKLVPKYLQDQFSSVGNLLKSGVPTVRNKEGSHGQGTEVSTVPEHLASYALHLTATNLLFLAKCEEQYRETI